MKLIPLLECNDAATTGDPFTPLKEDIQDFIDYHEADLLAMGATLGNSLQVILDAPSVIVPPY